MTATARMIRSNRSGNRVGLIDTLLLYRPRSESAVGVLCIQRVGESGSSAFNSLRREVSVHFAEAIEGVSLPAR